MGRSNKRLRQLCRKTLYTYSVGDTFTARDFCIRLQERFKTGDMLVNSDRIQWWFKGNPQIKVKDTHRMVYIYERIE